MKILNNRILLKAVKVANPLNPDITDHYEVAEIAEGITQVKKGDKVMFSGGRVNSELGMEYRLIEEDDLDLIL